jgi:hypothetical protein
LKIQWEIDFLSSWYIDPNHLKIKIRIKICAFSFKICFRNQFLTLGSGKTEITQILVFAYVLSVCPLPKVKNWFQKLIWNENIYISILNFCLWRFSINILKSQKNDFPSYFKKWFDRGRVHFLAIWMPFRIKNLLKLDSVGPVDNRPSTD